jgi:hypothetical protein
LGNFPPIEYVIVYSGYFLKIAQAAQIFFTVKSNVLHTFVKTWVDGYILGDFFPNSSGHPGNGDVSRDVGVGVGLALEILFAPIIRIAFPVKKN